MLRPHDIECLIIEWQLGCVSLAKIDEVRQADPAGEHRSGPAVFVRDVDAGDAATEFLCKTTRGPANTATDIEYVLCRIKPCRPGKLEGRCPSANMKFVDWCEVLGC